MVQLLYSRDLQPHKDDYFEYKGRDDLKGEKGKKNVSQFHQGKAELLNN